MTAFRFVLTALGAVALGLPTAVSAQGQTAPTRVAYVAVQAVLQRTPGYAQADSIWTQEESGYQRELQQLQARMDSATTAFDQQSVMLSPSNRAAEQKRLQELATQLNERVAQLRQRAAERQRELLDPIEQRVMAVIEGLRAEGNYALVFDISSQTSNIVAADKALDLTPRAIERLTADTGSTGND